MPISWPLLYIPPFVVESVELAHPDGAPSQTDARRLRRCNGVRAPPPPPPPTSLIKRDLESGGRGRRQCQGRRALPAPCAKGKEHCPSERTPLNSDLGRDRSGREVFALHLFSRNLIRALCTLVRKITRDVQLFITVVLSSSYREGCRGVLRPFRSVSALLSLQFWVCICDLLGSKR